MRKLAIAAIVLWLAVAWSLVTRATTPPNVPADLNRPYDPITLSGENLTGLLGAPVSEVFFYRYSGNTASQIPLQIDERNPEGAFVPFEDGIVDANDVLVFMANDAGEGVFSPTVMVNGTPLNALHQIGITNPADGTRAWVYAFRSAVLTSTVNTDYVAYDALTDRIVSDAYTLGFDPTHPIRTFLALGSNPTDLLDRDKLRVNGSIQILPPPFPPASFTIDEEDSTTDALQTIDGAVRVTRITTSTLTVLGQSFSSRTTEFYYRAFTGYSVNIDLSSVSGIDLALLRLSTDFSPAASGGVYYDSNNPMGVPIDGVVDSVVKSPAAVWQQWQAGGGSLISVARLPDDLGGSRSTYYSDSTTPPSGDTGDGVNYADAGLQINNPVETFTGTVQLAQYFAAGVSGAAGEIFLSYYDNPLQIAIDAPLTYPTPTPTLPVSATSTPSPTTTFTPQPTLTLTSTPPMPSATPTPSATASVPQRRIYLPLVQR